MTKQTHVYDYLYDHVLGCLATAAIGDAMGAATEQWAPHEIIAHYGGLVREFHAPPEDTFSFGNRAGAITDDTSQMFALAQAIVDADGNLTNEEWLQALVHWADTSPTARLMGPSTRPVVEAIRRGQDPTAVGTVGTSRRQTTHMGTTNGAAMRIAPAGLIHPGDVEGAAREVLVSSLPTHNTQVAISAAAAIAAGVAVAVTPGADVFSVARACLAGARLGEELGNRHARRVASPSVPCRIQLAVSLALQAQSLEEAMDLLRDHVGCSVYAAESVPTAIGLFVYAGGDPLESVVGGTNIGDDTDTIACMAGALAGALKGFQAVPRDLYCTLRAVNGVDIEALAAGLAHIAAARFSTEG